MKRAVLGAVAALTIAALTAACSSSGGGSATSNSSQTGAASGGSAKGAPITIGAVCSCSGAFGSDVSAGRKVAEAWAKWTNARGGVNGHPVQLTFKDDASNPGTSVTAAQSLISAHVDVILDLSNFDTTWEKQVSAAKIPVIGGNFSTEPYYTDPNWYPSGQTNDSIVYANVATAKAANGSKLGLLYCAEAPQCQQSVGPTKSVAKGLGLALAYTGSISGTAPNYTAQCLAAKQAGVDALIILDSPEVIRHVAQDCTRQNFAPAFVQEGTSFDDQALTAPGLKDHLWAEFATVPYFADTPAVRTMNAALDKYAPGLRTDEEKWSEYAVQAWSGMLLLQHAIKAAGIGPNDTVSAAQIIKGLNMTKNETLGGFSPPLTFTPGKPHPVDCWFTGRIQNGKPSLVNGGKLTCNKQSA